MKTRETFPGKWYAVTSASGCTVTFETKGDTVTLEMKAPQDVFCAVGSKVTISDDSATLTQTFNLAPSFFKAARGWGQDPIWFQSLHAVLTRLLDGTQFEMVLTEQGSKLIVHTDRVADDLLEQVRTTAEAAMPANIELVQYNHHIEVSWKDINRYAECRTLTEMNEVAQSHGFASYKEDLTSDGWWLYPLDNFTGILMGFFGTWESGTAEIRRVYLNLPKLQAQGADALSNCKNLEYLYLYAPYIAANCQQFVRNAVKLTYVDTYMPNISNIASWCRGCTSLSHFRFLAPLNAAKLTGGSYVALVWDGCVLDVASVQNIAENLPTMPSLSTTTIGIDEAYQNDEAMLEALALLESKNWNIELQTNPSPTSAASSTFSLRGKTIYAKVVEIDGVSELCWGHYVTHPEGYEEFRSLDSAYEYFGLPMPEET